MKKPPDLRVIRGSKPSREVWLTPEEETLANDCDDQIDDAIAALFGFEPWQLEAAVTRLDVDVESCALPQCTCCDVLRQVMRVLLAVARCPTPSDVRDG